jgi:uncharacterized RDD family membrane protein YckC
MSAAPAMHYAGFWRRSTAYAIDAHLVVLLAWLVGSLLGGLAHAQATDPNVQQLINMGWLQAGDAGTIQALLQANGASGTGGLVDMGDLTLWLIVSAAYNIWFVAGTRWLATPGKHWCKLQVVMANGARLNYFQASVRHAAAMLSWMTFGLGFVMIGLTKQKTALHDAVIGSRVIERPLPTPENPAIEPR